MPAQSVHQPFSVHVQDAHPQVKIGRRNRGRSVLMTTMEFRTAATSGMQVRAENASGLRISITGPKPGEEDFDERPSFEATATCRPAYNTRTAITVTHREVNLALIKRTNPVRFVSVAPIPEDEVPPLPPTPGLDVSALASCDNETSATVVAEEEDSDRPSLDDIPPRPSCPEPTSDDDEDDFPLNKRPFGDVSNHSLAEPPSPTSFGCPSDSSFGSLSEYSLALSQAEALSKSGRFSSLKDTVKLKLSGRAAPSTASLSRTSSRASLADSVKSTKGKKGMRRLLSTIGKGKRKSGVDEDGDAAHSGSRRKRSREDEENHPAPLEQDSKESREVKGRRIKRKLGAL
ncbi:hypothetical protein VKT23_016964 [Stygiomarasmius scandens]|uniref:Uncharacterized protein n=1 Tax=Marasmiellus scandens TaxID=2682957 RepID=A0ABR1IWS9_9AGAR